MSASIKHDELDEWFWRIVNSDTPDQRNRQLELAANESPELAHELHVMLEAAEQIGDFMRLPGDVDACGSLVRAESSPPAEPNELPPISAPFRLIRLIGEGGMGRVYLAEQVEPIQRQVALKVIKPGMDSRQVIARFEAERQALALMEHPNIAKVYDAGTTDNGLPFFAMELVNGIPLTDYCVSRSLSVHARLELFRDVCSAIQHAHNKGIIHRDIKPSNVLIAEQDQAAAVKVIDFGVAKALSGGLTEMTLLTGVQQMIGTPLYMSPEQASLFGVDVDTRSDVYSLGVMLYELLAGSLPVDRQLAKSMNYDELRRHICDSKPLRPSRRISERLESSTQIAEHPEVSRDDPRRLLTRELDWITMKAIEKDPDRRYQTPGELSADLGRYLTGHAVEACPPSLIYQLQKLSSRYRGLLASLACIFLLLIVGIGLTSYQAMIASKAREAARRNEALANQRSDRLRELLYAGDMLAATRHFMDGDFDKLQKTLTRYRSERESDRSTKDLRGFEWYLLNQLRSVKTRTVADLGDRVNSLRLSPDGSTWAVGVADGTVAMIDHASQEIVMHFPSEQDDVRAVDFISSEEIVSCGLSGSLAFWRLPASKEGMPKLLRRITVCDDRLFTLTVDRGSRRVFTAGNDCNVYQVDATTYELSTFYQTVPHAMSELAGSRTPKNRINALTLVSNKRLLAGLKDGSVVCFDCDPSRAPGSILWRDIENTAMNGVRDLSFADEANWVLAGQLRGSITLYDQLVSPRARFRHVMPSDVHSTAIDPTGQWLVVGDSSGHLHLITVQPDSKSGFLDHAIARDRRRRAWRAHAGKIGQVAFVESQSDPQTLAIWSVGRDGKVVLSEPLKRAGSTYVSANDAGATNDNELASMATKKWSHIAYGDKFPDSSVVTNLEGLRDPGFTFRVNYARDCRQAFFLVDETAIVGKDVIWKASEPRVARQFEISPDGQRFVATEYSRTTDPAYQIELREVGQSESIKTFQGSSPTALCFSPDGSVVAIVQNNEIWLLDASTGKRLATLAGHTDTIRSLAFSPDGSHLASVSSDRKLIVWDLENNNTAWSATAHENRATCVAFHPTLPTIATGGEDAIIRFWRTGSDAIEDAAHLVGEFPLSVNSPKRLHFSDDGDRLFIDHGSRGVSTLTATR